MNRTSTAGNYLPPTSSQTPTVEQAYLAQIAVMAQKPQTAAQIKAAGDVKVKVGVLWLVGVFCTVLGGFGGVVFINTPEHAKDFWVIIGPIISAAMTGTVAYLTGDKMSSGK